ncbi:MAG: histidinol dehydrogenase, partial [Chlorobiales bacterium]|nr:histidinol dehydrogenase [Chlorobiales bacterium]
MFQIITHTGNKTDLAKFLRRRQVFDEAVEGVVKEILASVRQDGDKAVRHYT